MSSEPATPVASINIVAICPSLELRNALIAAVEAAGGPKPALKSDSESAQRARYAPQTSQIIFNTASDRMHELLGKHSLAICVPAKNRHQAAYEMASAFVNRGFPCTVHTQAEPEFPDGFLIFLKVPALEGIVLMIWPTPDAVTPEIAATLPKCEPWA